MTYRYCVLSMAIVAWTTFTCQNFELSEIDMRGARTDEEQALDEAVLADAPECVQHLGHVLGSENRLCRVAFLYGAPGGGKTHGARALIRNSGRVLVEISPDDVSIGRYHESGNKLRQLLDSIVQLNSNVGILIDEADKLFEKPEQENRDTLYTSTVFTRWMDRLEQTGRTDIICICTGNDVSTFPQHLLSRLGGSMYRMDGPQTPGQKQAAFFQHLPEENRDTIASPEIKKLFEQYKRFSGRDMRTILDAARDLQAARGEPQLNHRLIGDAMKQIESIRRDSNYYRSRETMQEQQARQHNESIISSIALTMASVAAHFFA